MKNRILFMFFLATTLMSGTAGAECLVLNQLCFTNPYYDQVQHPYFQDMDFIANHDPNRCMQRAREWSNYCGNHAGMYTATYFATNGVYKLANVVYPGTTNYLYSTDFANRWILLQSSY